MRTTEIKEIGILKGFAIIAVLLIHTASYAHLIPAPNTLFFVVVTIKQLSFFAVPLFIFLSGLGLGIGYQKNFSNKSFYLRRMKSILPPYLLFSTFYFIIRHIELHPLGIPDTDIWDYLIAILAANAAYHLWFFSILIPLYIFFPLFHYAGNWSARSTHKKYLFIGIVILIHIGWIYVDKFSGITFTSITIGDKTISLHANQIAVSHLLYFTLGILLSRNLSAVMKKVDNLKPSSIIGILIITVGTICFFGDSKFVQYVAGSSSTATDYLVYMAIAPIFFFTMFVALYRLARRWLHQYSQKWFTKWISYIGRYSFGIYLVHVFFLFILNKILLKLTITPQSSFFYLILFLGTLTTSIIAVKIISLVPLSQYIIGLKSTHKNILHKNGK